MVDLTELRAKLRKIEESVSLTENKRWKAGGIPFYKKDGEVFVCLVIPTDPAYGGTQPNIPKGNPDPGDDPKKTAIREVGEETGIPNFKSVTPIGSKDVTGMTESYQLYVFAMEVADRVALNPDWEVTADWYTLEDALKIIRPKQKSFLEAFAKLVGEQ
jgi:8-oxo-dGTP pyrophosphatase MutT (NUDIX family)